MTGAILVGGKSVRMGTPKHELMFNSETLLERAVRKMALITSKIIVVGACREVPWPAERADDLLKNAGPLGGIHAALSASMEDCAVVACDMPFFSTELLSHMNRVGVDKDMTVVKVGEYWEPLHAVYRHSALPLIEKVLTSTRKVSRLYEEARVAVVDEAAVRAFGDPRKIFFNINSPDDYSTAKAIKSAGNVQ